MGCTSSQMVKSGKTSRKRTLMRIETGRSDETIRESGHPALVPGGCENVSLHDSDARHYYIKQHTTINSYQRDQISFRRASTDGQDCYLQRHLTIWQSREECQKMSGDVSVAESADSTAAPTTCTDSNSKSNVAVAPPKTDHCVSDSGKLI